MRDWKGVVPTIESLQPHGDDGRDRQLRKHQIEGYERAMLVVQGRADKNTVAQVTPGGGKTLFASIFAQVLLRAGFVTRVVIVVPRDSLREQMRDGFCDPVRGLDLAIVSVSSRPTAKDIFACAGYVTTYQSLGRGAKPHLDVLEGESILVIFDEVHHLVDDPEISKWVAPAKELADRAKHVLVMSGNLQRHKKERVPFVKYADGAATSNILYSRLDALEEHAIIPLDVDLQDGDTTFTHRGETHQVTLSTAPTKKAERGAIKTALKIYEYRDRLLTRAFASWLEYRAHYYHSQMIVVCEDQKEAREVRDYVQKAHRQFDVALAISDEPQAHRTLRKFRTHAGYDVLVTCQMAYEGLDAPWATHMVYLHRIRSFPWMEQATARLTRFNPDCGLPWEKQAAKVFAPGDKSWRKFVEHLRFEQSATYTDHIERALNRSAFARRSDFAPLAAVPTVVELGSERGLPPGPVQAKIRELVGKYRGLDQLPGEQLIQIAEDMLRASGES